MPTKAVCCFLIILLCYVGINLKPPGSDDLWLDCYDLCPDTGVGQCANTRYKPNGHSSFEHMNEDRFLKLKPNKDEDNCLYAIFDGHDGRKTVDFCYQRLPAEILLGQLTEGMDSSEVTAVLNNAFLSVEKAYFDSIGNELAQRAQLEDQFSVGLSTYERSCEDIDAFRKLEALNAHIISGVSLALCLIYENNLYVANVGDVRVLLCRVDDHGQLRMVQLSVDHTIENKDECFRLSQLDLTFEDMQHFNHTTRCIGDFPRKGGYKNMEHLSRSKAEPVIAEPDVRGPIEIDDSFQFLVIMNSGLYGAYEDTVGCDTATETNTGIAKIIYHEFHLQQTFQSVAQATVDRIGRLHHDAYQNQHSDRAQMCQFREDMCLLIRNFKNNLPSLSRTTTNKMSIDLDDETNGTEMSTEPLRNASIRQEIPVDADGRVAAYVDFSSFYKLVEEARNEIDDSDSVTDS